MKWSLQIAITLNESALLIFLQSGVEKLLTWPGIEPTTLDLGSQSSGYGHSAKPTLAHFINTIHVISQMKKKFNSFLYT